MRIAGIIAEYNPFHNGHAWQIAELRRHGFDAVAAVCSPGVVQRGEAAYFPTWVRTRAALAGGADLVLSLPAPYAVRSAEGFAAAGVAVLTALGCVDTLCFGADTLDTARALETAALVESAPFQAVLRDRIAAGLPLAAARAAAAESLCAGAGEALGSANDILAIEYCKALRRQNSPMTPLALPRVGPAHDAPLAAGNDAENGRGQGAEENAEANLGNSAGYDAKKKIASASALRTLCEAQGVEALAPYVPAACLDIYRAAWGKGEVLSQEAFGIAALSRLRALGVDELKRVYGVREGLENRLAAAIRKAGTWDELIEAMKTKRYATARLRRLALCAALGCTDELPPLPPYVHVLGASEAGFAILAHAKETAALPVSHSLARLAASSPAAARTAAAHAAAEDFTALCLHTPAPMGLSFSMFFADSRRRNLEA